MIQVGVDYYPEHWDKALWEEDAAKMQEAGVSVVRIAEFSWSRMEPEEGRFDFAWLDEAIRVLSTHGMKIILGTPTNCAPIWLYAAHPDAMQCTREGNRTTYGVRGHRCQNSSTFRRYAERIIRQMAERYAGRPEILAWQIDNEIENSHCTCPECTKKFQEYLRKRYGSIEALNRAFGNEVWSGEYTDFTQISKVLERGLKPDWHNPAMELAHERFCAVSSAEYAAWQASLIREYDPKAVITTNACRQMDTPDYHRMFKALDVVSFDNYPPVKLPEDPEEPYSHCFVLDAMRGLKRKNFWILEQLGGPMGGWGPITRAMAPGMLEGYAMQAVAHGADLVSFFRWRTSTSGAEMFCHGLYDHSNLENSRTREFRKFIKDIGQYEDLDQTTLHSSVAMLISYDQMVSCKNQMQSEGYSYFDQIRRMAEACANLGVNLDVIDEKEDFSGYKVVIVPEHFVLEESLPKRLKAFAEQGRTVLLTCRSGVKDENGNAILGRALPTVFSELTGSHVLEYDALGKDTQRIRSASGEIYTVTSWADILEADTAVVWASYDDHWYRGSAAVTVNSYGNGSVWYLGTVGEWKLYRTVLSEAFREQSIPYREDLPRGVEMTQRSNDKVTYTFLFNNTNEEQEVDGKRLMPFEMQITRQEKR